jgi:hypothetical protein
MAWLRRAAEAIGALKCLKPVEAGGRNLLKRLGYGSGLRNLGV